MDRTNSGSIDISVHMHKLKKSEVVLCLLLLRLHVKIDNFALFLQVRRLLSRLFVVYSTVHVSLVSNSSAKLW